MLKKKALSHILIIVLLVVGVLAGSSLALFSAAPLYATATPEHITLTWAGDPRTTQTITWRTDAATVAGQVQYIEAMQGKAFPQNATTVAAGVEGLSTNLGDVNIHSVTLSGLKPGTRYLYRVGDGSSWSEPRTFITSAANVQEFRFLVFGDSQSSNYDIWQATLHNAYKANPDAVFFTNVGDLVDVGQDYTQWNAWFDAARGVVDTIPAMPVPGNHETYTLERRLSLPVLFTSQFRLPSNGPEGLKGQVYSFDYGDVHFVVLDSQEGEEERFVPEMFERQKAWLEEDLRRTGKKWKVVFGHRPLYSNKAERDHANLRAAFGPILDKYHVDVVFTGHDHTYARTYPLHSGIAVDNPAKGTIYVATGRSGTKTYRDTFAIEWNEFFHNPQDEPNYITVEVRGDNLMVKVFTQSGVLIDVWSIDKTLGRDNESSWHTGLLHRTCAEYDKAC